MLRRRSLAESPIPDATGHWLNQPGMCPQPARIATAFSSNVFLDRLWSATSGARRSFQSCLEFEEGDGQLACIRASISTMSSLSHVPSKSVGIFGPLVAVPARRPEYHTHPSIVIILPEHVVPASCPFGSPAYCNSRVLCLSLGRRHHPHRRHTAEHSGSRGRMSFQHLSCRISAMHQHSDQIVTRVSHRRRPTAL